jgi:hypothetical protein
MAVVTFPMAFLAVLGAHADSKAKDTHLAELKIEMPEPNFGGTPLEYWGPNLELSYTPRPAFYAPGGATLLSEGKSVTSSDIALTPERLAMVTDGDKRWQSDSVLLLKPGVQYVQVDLEEPCEIAAVVLWHFHEYERVYFDVIVQASNDPDFKKGVTALYNNDHDKSANLGLGANKEYIEDEEGRLVDGKGVVARYVRLYSQGNTSDDGNTYIEVDVYGKPGASE